eukprot:2270659-Rhodomonas_salina.1
MLRRMAAFERWRGCVVDQREKQRVMKRVVGRLAGVQAARTLTRWREGVKEEREMRARAKRVVLRMLQLGLSRVLLTWREHVMTHAVWSKACAQTEQKRQGNAVAAGLAVWREAALASRKTRVAAERVVQMLGRGGVWKAWGKWRAETEAKRTHAARSRQIVCRLVLGGLRRAWEGWSEGAQKLVHLRSASLRVKRHAKRRMAQRTLRQWGGAGRDARVRRTQLRRAVEKLVSNQLLPAFDGWRHEAAAARRFRDVKRRVVSVVQGLVGSRLGLVLRAWQHAASEHGHCSRRARRARRHVARRRMGAVVRGWGE